MEDALYPPSRRDKVNTWNGKIKETNETEVVNDNKGLKGEDSRQIKENKTEAVV